MTTISIHRDIIKDILKKGTELGGFDAGWYDETETETDKLPPSERFTQAELQAWRTEKYQEIRQDGTWKFLIKELGARGKTIGLGEPLAYASNPESSTFRVELFSPTGARTGVEVELYRFHDRPGYGYNASETFTFLKRGFFRTKRLTSSEAIRVLEKKI